MSFYLGWDFPLSLSELMFQGWGWGGVKVFSLITNTFLLLLFRVMPMNSSFFFYVMIFSSLFFLASNWIFDIMD